MVDSIQPIQRQAAPTAAPTGKPVAPAAPSAAVPFGTDRLQLSSDRPAVASPGGSAIKRSESLTFKWGYHRNAYGDSNIRIQQPGYGTDVTLEHVRAEDRSSFQYLYTMPNGYPQIDEPQWSARLAYYNHDKGFGVELGQDHLKYTVQDFDQVVRFRGTLGGKPIDEYRPFRSLSDHYEHTNGLNLTTLRLTHAFPLPSRKQDSFSYNVKAGPGLLVTYTKSNFVNPQGQVEKRKGPYHLGGFAGSFEHSLEYALNNSISLELFHNMTYARVTDALIPHGKASQSIWGHEFGLTIGKRFDLASLLGKDKK